MLSALSILVLYFFLFSVSLCFVVFFEVLELATSFLPEILYPGAVVYIYIKKPRFHC